MERRDGGIEEKGKETARDRGRRKEGKEPKRGKERFKLLENHKKEECLYMVEAGSLDPWDTGFKCKAKVLNTRGRGGKISKRKNYCFVHCAQLGC